MQTREAALLRTEGKLCGIDSANAPRRQHSAVSLRARVTQADDAGMQPLDRDWDGLND